MEVRDRGSECLALFHVLGRVHERTFCQPYSAGRHDRAHGVEPEHCEAEASHLADHVLSWDTDVLEDELAGVYSPDSHLSIEGADRDAFSGPVDDERRDRVVTAAFRVAGLGEHGVPVRLHDTRHPTFDSVQDPSAVGVRVGGCPGAHAGDVTPGPGLRQAEAGPQGALRDSGQVALLLLLRAGDHDRPGRKTSQQQHQCCSIRVLRHLFDGESEAYYPGA